MFCGRSTSALYLDGNIEEILERRAEDNWVFLGDAKPVSAKPEIESCRLDWWPFRNKPEVLHLLKTFVHAQSCAWGDSKGPQSGSVCCCSWARLKGQSFALRISLSGPPPRLFRFDRAFFLCFISTIFYLPIIAVSAPTSAFSPLTFLVLCTFLAPKITTEAPKSPSKRSAKPSSQNLNTPAAQPSHLHEKSPRSKVVASCLLNVPAPCKSNPGTDLLSHLYLLPD